MPFGLVSAPQAFQRLMESLWGHLDYVECYLDDILMFIDRSLPKIKRKH